MTNAAISAPIAKKPVLRQSVALDGNWNLGFTQMLRATCPTMWGNWTLNSQIKPGAVGSVDPATGAFQYLADLPNVSTTDSIASQQWQIESSTTHRTHADVAFSGTVSDPTTKQNITAGVKTTWSFDSAGSIASDFTVAKQTALTDFVNQLSANQAWLVAQAAAIGMAPSGQIAQGFGVVTNVIYAVSGVNLGASTDQSSFSLEGSAEGMAAMAGGANVGASLKGSYLQEDETGSTEKHLWPASPNMVADDPIAIAFEFTSFSSGLTIPYWITPITGFSFVFDNAHGGTYVVNCTLTYDLPGTPGQQQSTSVSGGLTSSFASQIPLSATNLRLTLSFVAGGTHSFLWAAPLGQIRSGQVTVDLTGVWPGHTTATIRETGQTF